MLPKVAVRAYAQWSIRYKLMALLLMLALTTLAVTGTVAYIKNQNALKGQVFNQLTGVTLSKRSQIEAYYQTIHSHVETLSDDHMFIDAMREFRDAYRKMNALPLSLRHWMPSAKTTGRISIPKWRSCTWPGRISRPICR
jgi:hypothetical protein